MELVSPEVIDQSVGTARVEDLIGSDPVVIVRVREAVTKQVIVHGGLWIPCRFKSNGQGHFVGIEDEDVGIWVSLAEHVRHEGQFGIVLDDGRSQSPVGF